MKEDKRRFVGTVEDTGKATLNNKAKKAVNTLNTYMRKQTTGGGKKK